MQFLCRRASVCAALSGLLFAQPATAIVFGQFDTFQDGTAMNWSQDFSSPNQPTNIVNGGPAGVGDRFLRNISSGPFDAGSYQEMSNTVQWAGNYLGAGVSRIELDVRNSGTSTLALRVAFEGGQDSTRFASTNPIVVQPNTGWVHIAFSLNAPSLTRIASTETLDQTLADIAELRIVSALSAPSFAGDKLDATLDVDNIRATARPGDATRDRNVDFSDLLALAQNYGKTTGATWANGDFNYDAKVDFTDLLTLAQNYGSPATLVDASASSAFAADWTRARSLVPEPTAAVILLLPAAALRGRRRHGPGDKPVQIDSNHR